MKPKAKPVLGFQFDFEKKPASAKKAESKKESPASKKKAKKSNKDDDFINDDSEESDVSNLIPVNPHHSETPRIESS